MDKIYLDKFNNYLEYALKEFSNLPSEMVVEAISNTNYKNDTEKEIQEQIANEVRKLNI